MTLVCPRCGHAFEPTGDGSVACPQPQCRYEWNPSSSFEPTQAGHPTAPITHSLFVTFATGETRTVELSSSFTLGRSPENDLTVNDLRLSRRHLRIDKQGEAFYVKDLGSSSGTHLNGVRTAESRLSPGDRILAGDTKLEYGVHFIRSDPAGQQGVDSEVWDHEVTVPTSKVNPARFDKELMVFGRDAGCDVVLDSPLVSRVHAAISKDTGGFSLVDRGSANGVFVNGRQVDRRRLQPDDRIRIGPYVFTFSGTSVSEENPQGEITLEADHVGFSSDHVEILRDISLVICPNQFVALLGPSGAGKSTFLATLNGVRPVTAGHILANGESLASACASLKANIGYVPQDDIIHREISVWKALYYAARLRLPEDTSEDEISRILLGVLKTLELEERAHTKIHSLSGGQRKRVNLGVELVASPAVLLLDEPTSGLDPATETRMMKLFAHLAGTGRTVVITTHIMENLDQLDFIGILLDGYLAYFGPPQQALHHFQVSRLPQIFEKLAEHTAGEWSRRFAASRDYVAYVTRRKHASQKQPTSDVAHPRWCWSKALSQFTTLAGRHLACILGDPRNLLFLLAPGPIVGVLLTVRLDSTNELQHGSLLMYMAITAVFCGCFSSFREIIKERSIFDRERMVTLQIAPYVLSKFAILSGFLAVECFLLLGIVSTIESVKGSFLLHYASLVLASMSSVSLGLVLSAVVDSSEKAVGLLIVVILPQVIFPGGGGVPLEGVSKVAGWLMTSYWCRRALDAVAQGDNGVVVCWMVMTCFGALCLGLGMLALRRARGR